MNEKEHEILSERLMKIIKKYAYDKDVREELHTYLICAVLKHIFIPDDSPACMDLYHTCRADNDRNTHTEVYVGQIEAVLDLINRQG